jgi:hypothetical protein
MMANKTRNWSLYFVTSLVLASGSVAVAPQAFAQTLFGQARGPVQRVVHGRVEDKSGAGVKGAVVYLKDGRTASVKSAIANDQGDYRFVQLSANTDYEIWAQSDAVKSGTKTISSFDSKNDITITLKVDK